MRNANTRSDTKAISPAFPLIFYQSGGVRIRYISLKIIRNREKKISLSLSLSERSRTRARGVTVGMVGKV